MVKKLCVTFFKGQVQTKTRLMCHFWYFWKIFCLTGQEMINFCLCIWLRVHSMGIVTHLTSHSIPGLIDASSGGVGSCSCGALERASICPSVFASSLVPERLAVLIQRAHGAAQHAQVVLIVLTRFNDGRIFWWFPCSRLVCLDLSVVQDVKREVEEGTGEAVLLGGAEVWTCVATLEPTNQQTSLGYQHTLVRFDLQQIHRITDSFIKINRINKYFLGHTQQLNHRKTVNLCVTCWVILINHSGQEPTARLLQGQRSIFNLCAPFPADLTLHHLIDH